ncbi:TolC family outer membrane protein [Sphingomonas adhaesiva]|uniref:TolC family outer membrane protein n=1 Tax=Sphingomonas adhaesiva TaxID=28212 RepID=UPI002FFA0BD9
MMIAMMLAAAAAAPAAGDQPPAVVVVAPAQETLGQAIADAYRSNPTLEAQRARLRTIDEQVVQAGAPYRLRAQLNASLNYQDQRQQNFLGRFVDVENRTMGARVSVSQILLNGGRTAAAVSTAEAQVLAGREELRAAENATLYEVVDAFAAVLRDQELVAIQRRSVDSYGRQVDQAVARERGGELTRTDIAQASAQREIIRAQLAQAEANLQTSRIRFASAVGRNPGALVPPPVLPGLPATLDEAFAIADAEAPTLWQARMTARAGDARVSAERAERAPTVSLSGSYGYSSIGDYRTRDLRPEAIGGVTMTVPLLTGGVIGSRVRAAVADRQRLGFEVEGARRDVLARTQEAWNQSVAATEQRELGRLAVDAGRIALTGVRRSFGEGFRSNFEVLDSEQRLLNAQVLEVQAVYAAYVAKARVLAVLGRLQAATLAQGVPAYDAGANLRHAKAVTFGPFDPFLAPIDRASVPGAASAPPPVLPVAVDTRLRTAAVTELPGPLGSALPVGGAPVLMPPTVDALSDAGVTGG